MNSASGKKERREEADEAKNGRAHAGNNCLIHCPSTYSPGDVLHAGHYDFSLTNQGDGLTTNSQLYRSTEGNCGSNSKAEPNPDPV